MREIRLKARAKINLTLDVTGKREDGYHLLETIMQTVALYDGNQPAMAADGCAQSGVEGGKSDAGDLRHKGGGVY